MTDEDKKEMIAIFRQIIDEAFAKKQLASAPSRVGLKNHGLLSFEDAAEALKPLKVSAQKLRRAASDMTPFRKRLKVVRLGHRTVGIKPIQLEDWKERCNF